MRKGVKLTRYQSEKLTIGYAEYAVHKNGYMNGHMSNGHAGMYRIPY